MPFTLKQENIDPEKSLCSTCESGLIIKRNSETSRYCNDVRRPIKGIVTECSGYSEKGALDLYELKQIAWIISVDKTRKIGFSPPKDHGKKPRAFLDDDGDLAYINEED